MANINQYKKLISSKFLELDKKNHTRSFSMHDWSRTFNAFDTLLNARSVIDIGSGGGQLVNLLSDFREQSIKVSALDYKDCLIFKPNSSNFSFVKHDLKEKIDIKERFHVVNAMEVLEHIEISRLASLILELISLSHKGLLYFSVPFQEKEPLYHGDRPYGHKQSFNEEKIINYFPKGTIVTSFRDIWYLGLRTELEFNTFFTELKEFKKICSAIITY